jgi:hypothetical protein
VNTSRPIIIAGCGPSISNVPEKLWFTLPVFAVNRFIAEHHITPEYWTGWDTWSLIECLPIAQSKGSNIHLNKRIWNYYRNTFPPGEYDVEWWTDHTRVPGVPTNEQTGLVFIGTTHAALWRAHMLGYNEFYIVGFDCTIGIEPVHDNNHFYGGGKAEVYAQSWDEQMAAIAKYLESCGKEVWNISKPTSARITPMMPMEAVLERYS